MKIIENLNVKVTYNVILSDVEVSDDVYEDLMESESITLPSDKLGITPNQVKALEWMQDNIREDDYCNIEYEIEDIE